MIGSFLKQTKTLKYFPPQAGSMVFFFFEKYEGGEGHFGVKNKKILPCF
jgi:hypothetical protein